MFLSDKACFKRLASDLYLIIETNHPLNPADSFQGLSFHCISVLQQQIHLPKIMLTIGYLFRNRRLMLLLVSSLLFIFKVLPAQGQLESNDLFTPSNSATAYWRVHTDYKQQMTCINFYTAQHNLLYQEKIKDRFVKLSKHTIRQFDQLLAKLVTGHLVADRVKTYDLLASNQWNTLVKSPQAEADEPNSVMPLTSPDQLTVTLRLINEKKLLLSYLNPPHQPLIISMADDSFRFLYKEVTSLPTNDKLFDVSQLASGTYRFEVDGGQQSVVYRLVIPANGGRMELKRFDRKRMPQSRGDR